MTTLAKALERLALWVVLIGGVGMAIATLLGTADVVGTQILGRPVPGALEMTEATMVLIVFGGLAYAQIRRSHIRVELIYARSGPRARAAMDVVSDLAALLFFGLLLWQAANEAVYSWSIGESADGLIRFPVYPARIVLCLGTALMLGRLGLDLVLDTLRLIEGRDSEPPPSLIPEDAVRAAMGIDKR
jgi:TRAP-type C4-dicarboxylate transport system permease small subunit